MSSDYAAAIANIFILSYILLQFLSR